jgi:hypothetical protein
MSSPASGLKNKQGKRKRDEAGSKQSQPSNLLTSGYLHGLFFNP